MNATFDHFRCSTLTPRQDRPHKVYIFLKLRAFCMHSQQGKGIQAHLELQQYCESWVYHTLNLGGVCGNIEIHLLQHTTYFLFLSIFVIHRPSAKKSQIFHMLATSWVTPHYIFERLPGYKIMREKTCQRGQFSGVLASYLESSLNKRLKNRNIFQNQCNIPCVFQQETVAYFSWTLSFEWSQCVHHTTQTNTLPWLCATAAQDKKDAVNP